MNKTFEESIQRVLTSNSWKFESKMNEAMIREIFVIKHEVNLQKDETGMPIPGTGRTITNEEKKMVFDYMLERNYPMIKKLYNLILKAYVDGEIVLEKADEVGTKRI